MRVKALISNTTLSIWFQWSPGPAWPVRALNPPTLNDCAQTLVGAEKAKPRACVGFTRARNTLLLILGGWRPEPMAILPPHGT